MIKHLFIITLITLSSFSVAKSKAEGISGIWDTGEDTLVEINTSDKPIVGKVIETTAENGKVGTIILSDFQQTKEGWKVKIYAPKRNKHFPAQLTLENDELNIAIDAGFFTKNVKWQRHNAI